jgi:phosphoribosylanthranilate isomerase
VTELPAVFSRHSGIVKICGLREPEHAAVAAAAGADLLGFIFAPARRQVTPAEARTAIAAARSAAGPRGILAVGVFVDAAADAVNDTAATAMLDLVQLHGNEPAAMIEELIVPALKVFRPRPGDDPDEIEKEIERYLSAPRPPVAVVVDGYSERGAGGEGVGADWSTAARLAVGRPFVLAGGLTPENVGEAIERVSPTGVDVSSGVETDGIKDPRRIATFVSAARAAFGGANSALP